MLDIKKIKENKKAYLEAFSKKGYFLEKEVDQALNLFDSYLDFLKKEENLRFSLNAISDEISNEIKNNKGKINDHIQTLKNRAKEISDSIPVLKQETETKLAQMEEIISYFPNVAFSFVPIGKDENDNKVISTKFEEKNKIGLNHFEIFDLKKDLVFQEEASIISGSRNVIYGDKLTKLLHALESFMLEQNNKNFKFDLVEAPVIVNERMLFNTGQLPKFKEDLFKLENGKYLIPTSEVTLTNLFAGKILKEEQLPIRVTSLSNCFRSEAGSAGKDTRGIIRVHQFRKVELVTIGKKDDFKNDLDHMLKAATNILNLLEIPYRIVELCTGDMSFGSAVTYDIEVWLPGQKTYREISSVSCMSDFQSRRMKTRFKNSKNESEFVYTYNGSSLALERTIVAVIENYYNKENNKIIVPKVLEKYLDFKEF